MLAAGRCIRADGQVLGPSRIMSTCFAVGEAAGTSAFLIITDDKPFKDIDVSKLQNMLRKRGAIIDV
jgi:hypothetical protein